MCIYLPISIVLSASSYYKWGLVGYMGSEILATDGKFVFSTPIARDRQAKGKDLNDCRNYDNYFCYKKERKSGSIASYSSGSYKIGMHALILKKIQSCFLIPLKNCT